MLAEELCSDVPLNGLVRGALGRFLRHYLQCYRYAVLRQPFTRLEAN